MKTELETLKTLIESIETIQADKDLSPEIKAKAIDTLARRGKAEFENLIEASYQVAKVA